MAVTKLFRTASANPPLELCTTTCVQILPSATGRNGPSGIECASTFEERSDSNPVTTLAIYIDLEISSRTCDRSYSIITYSWTISSWVVIYVEVCGIILVNTLCTIRNGEFELIAYI